MLGRSNGLPDQTVEFDFSRLPEPVAKPDAFQIEPLRIKVDRDEWTRVVDLRKVRSRRSALCGGYSPRPHPLW